MLLVAAAVATALVAMALQRNVAYLYTPSEVLKGEAGDRTRASASAAWSQAGSFKRAPGSMEAHFAVDDGDAHAARRLHRHPSRTCSARSRR